MLLPASHSLDLSQTPLKPGSPLLASSWMNDSVSVSLCQCHWSDPCSSSNFLERQAILRATILLLILSLADWPRFCWRVKIQKQSLIVMGTSRLLVCVCVCSTVWGLVSMILQMGSSRLKWYAIKQNQLQLERMMDDKKLNKPARCNPPHSPPLLLQYKSKVTWTIYPEWQIQE